MPVLVILWLCPPVYESLLPVPIYNYIIIIVFVNPAAV